MTVLRFLGLMLLDAMGLIIVYTFIWDGNFGMAAVFAIITIGLNLMLLVPSLYPLKWMSPGLALVTLLVIYPIILTVLTAFTNYGDGHLFTRGQAIQLIRDRGYVPEGASTFSYLPYRAGEDSYALWLIDAETGEISFLTEGEPQSPVDMAQFGFSQPSSVGYAPTTAGDYGVVIGAINGSGRELTYGDPIGAVPVVRSLDEVSDGVLFAVVERTPNFAVVDVETGEDVGTLLFRDGEDGISFALTIDNGQTTYLALPDAPVVINNSPVVEGFSPTTGDVVLESGIESFSFPDPLGEVEVRTLDPIVDQAGALRLSPRWVYDYEEGLTVDRNFGIVYDTTIFLNPAGEYAYWLTESGTRGINEARLILPNAPRSPETFSLTDRARLNARDIDLTTGTTIPDSIGAYDRTDVSDDLAGLTRDDVTGGFGVMDVDFSDTLVYDPTQGYIYNAENGELFRTTPYVSDDGDTLALWVELVAATDNSRGLTLTTLFASQGGTILVNGAPLSYEGYDQVLTPDGRSTSLSFLQNMEVDYFGDPDETDTQRLGIINETQAGRPFLLRYVWNRDEAAFVDLSTINAQALGDIEALDLENTDPFAVAGLTNVTYFVADGSDGQFKEHNLQFVFNDDADAYVRLDSAILTDPENTSAEQIAVTPFADLPFEAEPALYRYIEAADVFVPQAYLYNANGDVIVDPGESGADPDVLASATLDDLLQIEGVTVYVYNEEAGFYALPTWYYNETSDNFLVIEDSVLEGLDLEGLDLLNLDPQVAGNLLPEALTLYDEFADQGVYAPVYVPNDADGEFDPDGFIFNTEINAFVDMGSLPSGVHDEVVDVAVETADLDALEAFERADIYRFNEATGIYVTDQYVYNSTLAGFIDLEDLPEELPQGVDPVTANLFEIEGFETITVLSQDAVRGPLLYADEVEPVFNSKLDAFIFPAPGDYTGFDLTSFNPETLLALDDVEDIAARSATMDSRTGIVYSDDLTRSAQQSDRYVLSSVGGTVDPGFRVNIGLGNFRQLVEDADLLSSLINIFVWTVTFALLSVLTTFTMGLFMALILNDDAIPGKKIIRSLLIVPYAIPGVIAILVWQGMLNQNLGIITNGIADAFGFRIPWFSDPWWAKTAIILVNLWLGYPYMMLVTSGALSAIPSDVYEAAAVDGAKAGQRFWGITLPLLLVTVGPLLIASFTYNFNNYLMIELLTAGDPPIVGAATPAGQTDILISYTYNLAFANNRGADYGYASAITIVIFALTALVTMFQYRFTRQWEEVGENV